MKNICLIQLWTATLYLIELMKRVIKPSARKQGQRTTLQDRRSKGLT